eukprot:NODE_2368_length_1196_cov_128.998129_g2254_i0.p1 GENE.NODE_2368_length_1196_cov_128.998129_g2254_i0~~NODE_2368_length_1196_cov_128.998129_g2254_i0.p1  ORF type:complete len:377 (+),score=89.35 NODE_2368_length_1196_cov_128.998129_g2254_i0:46-1131(+)
MVMQNEQANMGQAASPADPSIGEQLAISWTLMLIGRTGDGKSAAANALARSNGHGSAPFAESAGAASHTHAVQSLTVAEGLQLKDTPGLMDSNGVEQDEANIRLIVTDARQAGRLHAFLLVINEQAPRFDSPMNDAVKLVIDSFGPAVLQHMGVLYTRAYGGVSAAQARQFTETVAQMIGDRAGLPAPQLPFWQVDLHPEQLEFTAERIARTQVATAQALREMTQWAKTRPPLDTANAEFGEYEVRRRAREAEAAREAEKRRREYEGSVINTREETEVVEVSRKSDPQYRSEERSRRQWKGGLVPKWGNACKETVRWTEQVLAGHTITKSMARRRRTIQTLGSGQEVPGDWVTIESWEEVE